MTANDSMALLRKAAGTWYDGNPAGAETLMRQLLAAFPDFHIGHYMFGCLLLSTGRWREAWPHFERRIALDQYRPFHPLFPHVRFWEGGEVPPGSSLMVLGDMGYGDIIMCARFLPQAMAGFGSASLVVPPGLKCLLAGQVPGLPIFESGEPLTLPSHAAFTFSLMRLLDVTPQNLDNRPYLKADPELVEKWRNRLEPQGGLKVGLVWRGSPLHPTDAERSLRAAQVQPLMRVPGVRFISLQRDATADDLALLAPLEHDPAATATFADMAAVMANLDLVISVDTAPAHLAGALGRPVWIALQFTSDWRWLPEWPDTLWYQSARLFRPARRHDGDGVVAAMADALALARFTAAD